MSKSLEKLHFLVPFFAFVLLSIYWLLLASPDTVILIIRFRLSGIEDYEIFPSREMKPRTVAFHFVDYPDVPIDFKGLDYGMHENASLEDFLEANDTVVFLIIRDDMILFERYYGGYSA